MNDSPSYDRMINWARERLRDLKREVEFMQLSASSTRRNCFQNMIDLEGAPQAQTNYWVDYLVANPTSAREPFPRTKVLPMQRSPINVAR
ncbi:hypothetical protein J2W42_003994 [Rhizobium tibeticum]|nr:hypothetical protein [Rhizobium tibeticum]